MKRVSIAAVLVGLALSPSAGAAEALTGVCDIVFKVKATMHSFDGLAVSEPVMVEVNDGTAAWQVDVTVTNMTTDNAKRDREMHEMFHSEEYPRIVGTAAGVVLEELRNGAEIPLTLTIRDQSMEHAGTVSKVNRDADAVYFDVAWPVSLKAYGLTPPKVLFFVVHDEVRVIAHFAMTPPDEN